jgi:large subunit ribosomal protein L5
VVNCGLGADAGNSKGLEAAMKDLAMITGQWPVKTKARKSVASFKIREGNTIGIAVTLRGRVSPILLFIWPPQSSYFIHSQLTDSLVPWCMKLEFRGSLE